MISIQRAFTLIAPSPIPTAFPTNETIAPTQTTVTVTRTVTVYTIPSTLVTKALPVTSTSTTTVTTGTAKTFIPMNTTQRNHTTIEITLAILSLGAERRD